MEFEVAAKGHETVTFVLPDEIGDMTLYLLGIMNTMHIREEGIIAATFGKSEITIARIT